MEAFVALVVEKVREMAKRVKEGNGVVKDVKWLVFCNSSERVDQVSAALGAVREVIEMEGAKIVEPVPVPSSDETPAEPPQPPVELRITYTHGHQDAEDRTSAILRFASPGRTGDDPSVQSESTTTTTPRLHTLITSDIASRGVDFADVDVVVQIDMALNAADYLHRVGRCARMGREGEAITMVTPSDATLASALQRAAHGGRLPSSSSSSDGGEDVQDDDLAKRFAAHQKYREQLLGSEDVDVGVGEGKLALTGLMGRMGGKKKKTKVEGEGQGEAE
ncbi:hypothetical protein HK104_010349 [Borealophlyctis nickersoniae]|nr:hypothetical protein HK104_010349 [Borealophlyctis nickersoniae]